MHQFLLEPLSITCKGNMSRGLNEIVSCDRNELGQFLMNILAIHFKFTKGDRVLIAFLEVLGEFCLRDEVMFN